MDDTSINVTGRFFHGGGRVSHRKEHMGHAWHWPLGGFCGFSGEGQATDKEETDRQIDKQMDSAIIYK